MDGVDGAEPRDPVGHYAGTSLRLQVLEIIASLLNSTGPELEKVRVRLQNLVRQHPWDPELALLLHLSGPGLDTAPLQGGSVES